ncbi:tetratricopeptide repeat protein [Shewanella goraebulensis]|uniref:tetratricopeptide repeat protein n=1 Tax=Shewanella goraebulensis TaxID=3050637 RepID=UPI002551A1DA|nr:tetratricopeptide repeat protein [Shewanella goraebulensis]
MKHLSFIFIILVFIPLPSTALIQTTSKSLVNACDTQECHNNFVRYKSFSKQGYVDAMYVLAEFYYQGYGTQQNTERALKWYRKAAKYNSGHAQFKAGVIYLKEGKYQDIERGIKYLEKASKNNLNAATHLLGLVYLEGKLVDKDIEKASEYLTKSYDNKYPDTVKFIAINKDDKNFTPIFESAPLNLQSVQTPTDEMETISVTAPTLNEVFKIQISYFESTYPNAARGTGTSIPGRSCAEVISCGVEANRERIRDFFLLGW